MRRFTAIILLISFVVAQYAKQVSYLECMFSNNFKALADKCDCEKILNEDKDAADQYPLPVSHKHVHPDESYCLPQVVREIYFSTGHLTHIAAACTKLNDGVSIEPDRPPQF
ncbi:MAG TPA: hypothetical protein VIZ28_11020 [Chitinophagaceae bacterium]